MTNIGKQAAGKWRDPAVSEPPLRRTVLILTDEQWTNPSEFGNGPHEDSERVYLAYALRDDRRGGQIWWADAFTGDEIRRCNVIAWAKLMPGSIKGKLPR